MEDEEHMNRKSTKAENGVSILLIVRYNAPSRVLIARSAYLSSPTMTISHFNPSDLAFSIAIPKFNLSPV